MRRVRKAAGALLAAPFACGVCSSWSCIEPGALWFFRVFLRRNSCLLVVTCAVLQHGMHWPSGRYPLDKRIVELGGCCACSSVERGMRLQRLWRCMHRAVTWCMLNTSYCTNPVYVTLPHACIAM